MEDRKIIVSVFSASGLASGLWVSGLASRFSVSVQDLGFRNSLAYTFSVQTMNIRTLNPKRKTPNPTLFKP